jgi:hypothetical protein
MRAHLQDQVSRYGAASLVNLINHKGHEKPIKEAYEKYVKQVRLLFHDWCPVNFSEMLY